MQIARNARARYSHFGIVWVAIVVLGLMLGFPAVLLAQEAAKESPAAAPKGSDTKKSETRKARAKKESAKKSDKKGSTKTDAADDEKKAPASAAKEAGKDAGKPESKDEPKVMAAGKLPKPIRTLHTCAAADANVEVTQERYAKSVLFMVTCTAERGKLTPIAVYLARDARGNGAKRVKFEMLPAADGAAAISDTVFSGVPAREAYTEPGERARDTHTKDDTPWLSGAWRPDDRPGVCAVSATWKMAGDKGELWYWEEAKECATDALPKYETKLDKKPPTLVQR